VICSWKLANGFLAFSPKVQFTHSHEISVIQRLSQKQSNEPYDRGRYGNGSNDNPQKDNFHNAIFGIDKTVDFGIVNSTLLINFLFPEGVMDGERPLKFSHGVEFFLCRCYFKFFSALKFFKGLSN
jgi:hypothetical protein